MTVFVTLLMKVIPLYTNMLLGFVAGKWLKVDRQSIGALMIYIIAPMVFFHGIAKMEVTPLVLTVPLLSFVLSCIISYPAYRFARHVYADSRPNIIAVAAGTGNIGYFGLPIAMLLFDQQTVGIYLILMVGISVFEASIGFYITAKGQHSARESFMKTLRVPVIHSLVLGAGFSMAGLTLPPMVDEFLGWFGGAYVVLGMMMIGLGLSSLKKLAIDWGFIGILFTARFVAWPLLALAVVALDTYVLGFYGEGVHQSVLLISFMPLSANAVAIASVLKCEPEKMATASFLSAVVAIIYVPLMVALVL